MVGQYLTGWADILGFCDPHVTAAKAAGSDEWVVILQNNCSGDLPGDPELLHHHLSHCDQAPSLSLESVNYLHVSTCTACYSGMEAASHARHGCYVAKGKKRLIASACSHDNGDFLVLQAFEGDDSRDSAMRSNAYLLSNYANI